MDAAVVKPGGQRGLCKSKVLERRRRTGKYKANQLDEIKARPRMCARAGLWASCML